jgi:putative tryptophan/tyrosine transport system substrate-binding protein
MKRREFMVVIGGAAVSWPLTALAQQQALPVVGFLSGASARGYARNAEAFRQGLSETGYVEGRNVFTVSRTQFGNVRRQQIGS